MSSTMTAVDFLTGILAGAALRGETALDLGDTQVDQALAAAYDELLEREEVEDLDIDFQIIPDRMHGDSTVVQDAITAAIQSRLAGRVNPRFQRVQITIDKSWAQTLTEELPGGRQLYIDLAATFLAEYRGYAQKV